MQAPGTGMCSEPRRQLTWEVTAMLAEGAARALPYLRQEGRHEQARTRRGGDHAGSPGFGSRGPAVQPNDGGRATAWLPG
jgi:hypothetical protein